MWTKTSSCKGMVRTNQAINDQCDQKKIAKCVCKSCPKMISLEKWLILTPLQKLPKNVRDLGKLIVPKGFKKLPINRPIWSHCRWGTYRESDNLEHRESWNKMNHFEMAQTNIVAALILCWHYDTKTQNWRKLKIKMRNLNHDVCHKKSIAGN